jgi:hypothetical protein
MGSIRENMRKRAEDAKSVIGSFKFQRDDLTKTIEVLEFAEKVLAGEPRGETKTALVIHYAQVSRFIDIADCVECGAAEIEGWKPNWRYCPLCGSAVTRAERENNPNDRLTRNALRDAVAAVTK